jgi:hypothetical protein
MSHNPVFCSIRSDLDRVAADLAGASRIALDIETYGSRKGDGLDPWKGDIRLLTLSRHGGTIWTIDLRATGYELGPLTQILEQATRTLSSNTSWDSTPQAVVASVAGALGGLRFSTRHPRAAFGLQKPEGHPYAPGTRSPDLTNRGRRNHGGPGSNGKMAARHSPTLFPALGGPRQRVARTRPE